MPFNNTYTKKIQRPDLETKGVQEMQIDRAAEKRVNMATFINSALYQNLDLVSQQMALIAAGYTHFIFESRNTMKKLGIGPALDTNLE